MKMSKMNKRILALILCFTMVCSQNILALAEEGAENPTITETSAEPGTETVVEEAAEETEEPAEEEPTEEPESPAEEEPAEEPESPVVEEPTEEPEKPAEEEMTEEPEEPAAEEPTEDTEEPAGEEGAEDSLLEEEPAEEPVITRYDYKSDVVNVLVTLTNPEDLPDEAELVVTPVALSGEQEIGIGEAATADGIILKEIHAFDIKFMLDGEEIQPGETVKVTISLPGMKMDEDTAVYHIDENDNIENMDGDIDGDGNVEFETPHFSTYVVVPTEDGSGVSDFSGYGLLGSSRSGGVLEYNKTAKVDDWNKRTYDIEITAKATLTETNEVQKMSDGMLIVDMSGSMLKLMDSSKQNYSDAENAQVRLGRYKDVLGDLDKETFYYVYTGSSAPSKISYQTDNALADGKDTTSRIIAYLDYDGTESDGWYYYNVKYVDTVPKEGTTYQADKWIKMADNSAWYVYDFDTSRINNLKRSVLSYMETVAQVSPSSRLGLVTFYESGYKALDFASVASGSKLDVEVVKKIAALRPQREWCTYPNKGLELAFQEMVSTDYTYSYNSSSNTGSLTVNSYNSDYLSGKDVPKYIILFSDGQPDGPISQSSNYSGDAAEKEDITNETIIWADALKKAGIKIYTVAFAYYDTEYTWLTDIASGSGYVYQAGDLSELANVLTNIKDQETTIIDHIDVNVYDYIDPRFVVLDNSGNPITKSGVQITTTGSDGIAKTGTVYFDGSGRQYVVWANQEAKNTGSSWKIKVQAKSDYIGGNNVTTNISTISKIDAGNYGDFILPNPTVNVKATMEIGNNNVIIYKGTAAPTGHASASDPLTMLYNAKAKINEYLKPGYAGVTSDDFTLQWYTDAACTNLTTIANMAAARLNGETNYYLKFTYNPGDATSTSNANTTKNGVTYVSGRNEDDGGSNKNLVEARNVADKTKNYGIYNIRLWQIVKRANDGANTPLANAEFTLKSGANTYYGKSDATGFVALYTDAAHKNLALNTPLGTYTFAETAAPEGYLLSSETWTLKTSLATTASLANGVDSISSSAGKAVLKETPAGVVASYIYLNDIMQYELPSTGGIGTAVFTRAGLGLLLGAAVLTVAARRKEDEN